MKIRFLPALFTILSPLFALAQASDSTATSALFDKFKVHSEIIQEVDVYIPGIGYPFTYRSIRGFDLKRKFFCVEGTHPDVEKDELYYFTYDKEFQVKTPTSQGSEPETLTCTISQSGPEPKKVAGIELDYRFIRCRNEAAGYTALTYWFQPITAQLTARIIDGEFQPTWAFRGVVEKNFIRNQLSCYQDAFDPND